MKNWDWFATGLILNEKSAVAVRNGVMQKQEEEGEAEEAEKGAEEELEAEQEVEAGSEAHPPTISANVLFSSIFFQSAIFETHFSFFRDISFSSAHLQTPN